MKLGISARGNKQFIARKNASLWNRRSSLGSQSTVATANTARFVHDFAGFVN
jgi:hypothetical protein